MFICYSVDSDINFTKHPFVSGAAVLDAEANCWNKFDEAVTSVPTGKKGYGSF